MRSCVRGEGKPLSTVDSAGQSAHAKQMGVFFLAGLRLGQAMPRQIEIDQTNPRKVEQKAEKKKWEGNT